MKQFQWLLFVLGVAACASEEPPTSAAISGITAAQGVSYQGVSYQGVSYQGVSYQGVSYQGANAGGVALSDASVLGSALVVWKQRPDLTWEQWYPDKICLWDATRTVMTPCTSVNLATTPSPLAGATWQAVYTQADGTTVQVPIEIGASATAVGAVQSDTTLAMFALNGSTASSCPLVRTGTAGCDAPGGCRTNCDVWLYDVRLPGSLDAGGQPLGLCPPGQLATALAGTWDGSGAFTPSSTLFTFACTGGTIAKCTRWGYRPWSSAVMSDGATSAPLAPYHQACVRAATADYCADGHSFTQNGTLIDIYDYSTYQQSGAKGFIEQTRGALVPYSSGTALVWESRFDRSGATQIDHARFQELTGGPACADLFVERVGVTGPWFRAGGNWTLPMVSVDSTPACSHAESTVGKWLHTGCSACTALVHDSQKTWDGSQYVYPFGYCTTPGGRWDSACVQAAQVLCAPSSRMAPHGECVSGAGIGKFATGCALKLQLIIDSPPGTTSPSGPYTHCATSWDSTCVSGANAMCTGGQETSGLLGGPSTGFCGPLRNGM